MMLAALLFLQITQCDQTSTGRIVCRGGRDDPPRQTQYVDTDWTAIFETARRNRHQRAVGKMLAKGDCAGAERYALEKGDIGLAERVKAYCAR